MLGKLENGNLKTAGGNKLEHDGKITVNPRDKDFIEVGYKPVEDNRLPEKDGYYQVAEYTEEEDKIVATYHYEEIVDEQETIA